MATKKPEPKLTQERVKHPTNEELLDQNPELKEEDEKGKEDFNKLHELSLHKKDEANAFLAWHNENAENGPPKKK